MNRREWLVGAFALTVARPLPMPSVWGTPVDVNALPEPLGPFEEVSGALNFSLGQRGREFHSLDAFLGAERYHQLERDLLAPGACVTKVQEGEPDEVYRIVSVDVQPVDDGYAVSCELERVS